METQGKFVLMTLSEFEGYINSLDISGFRKITQIQIHHTWSPSYRNFNGRNHFAKLTSMEAYHIANGFGQIGQHYTTFPDGTIAVCRNLALAPACIAKHNTGDICIENLGNFDIHGDTMSLEHRKTILHLNALLCRKFQLKINTDTIIYHHWFRQSDGFRDNALGKHDLPDHKTCPGTNFFGGNTVAEAAVNFIPGIQQAYDRYALQTSVNQPVVVQRGIVHANVLNVRRGPGIEFDVVRKLNRDEVVSILETNDEWDRIGENQWVKADYIALTRAG
jgi:hypothetical protein